MCVSCFYGYRAVEAQVCRSVARLLFHICVFLLMSEKHLFLKVILVLLLSSFTQDDKCSHLVYSISSYVEMQVH